MLTSAAHHRASLWQLTRADGLILRFTDHSGAIEFEGNTYTPVAGMDASARRRGVGLKNNTLQVIGVIDSDAITEADLDAGLYRNTEIVEHVIDWRYPWLGSFRTNAYNVRETTHSDVGWTAEIAGLSMRLRVKTGRTLSRTCDFILGDSRCKVDLGPLTESGAVTAVDSSYPRKRLQTDRDQPDRYWQFGDFIVTSGPNAGLTFKIQQSYLANGEIFLVQSAPRDFEVGDQFDITPGCNHTTDHCKDKEDKNGVKIFDNIENYGGHGLFSPGNDRMLKTPNAK